MELPACEGGGVERKGRGRRQRGIKKRGKEEGRVKE